MKYPQLVSMPSAVSDWLEEQLEVRGIDALVYTRYVLSLLHTHTVDVICSDEDLYLSHLKKEVKSTICCSTNDWWRNADAEKLKRSEAVKCLMSATEQNCEIESLIDELCAKLKEIKSDNNNKTDFNNKQTNQSINKNNNCKKEEYSAKELAEKYYAAFPPLKRNKNCTSNNNNSNSTPTKLIKFKLRPQKSTIPTTTTATTIKTKKYNKNSRMNRNENYIKRKQTQQHHQQQQQHHRYNNYFKRNNKRSNDGKKINLDQCAMETNLDEVEEEELTMYDDLPVDINELLDSPSPTKTEKSTKNDVEMMNMRNTGNKIDFIPYGYSSIWSKRDILLDPWSWHTQKIDNDDDEEEDEKLKNFTLSLLKLNHHPERSHFMQVIPRTTKQNSVNPPLQNLFYYNRNDTIMEKDDLLTSERSHFKPIIEKPPTNNNNAIYQSNGVQQKYADGATFYISNNLDHIQYKRSSSGFMYMENDGKYKKYSEYNKIDKQQTTTTKLNDFVLKFNVLQNDKACQTDEQNDKIVDDELLMITNLNNTFDCDLMKTKNRTPIMIDEQNGFEEEEIQWRYGPQLCDKCNNNNNTNGWDTNSMKNVQIDEKWWGDSQRLRNIWNNGGSSSVGVGGAAIAGDVCCTCMNNSQHNTLQLRKDISQDGEQLLSDLSSLQKVYMGCDFDDDEEEEEEVEDEKQALPKQQQRCCTTDIIKPIIKECKRRHSFISITAPNDNDSSSSSMADLIQMRNSWSFASRLEEDCLIQMSTVIPTLRSVTL